jgi:hypothetical protein
MKREEHSPRGRGVRRSKSRLHEMTEAKDEASRSVEECGCVYLCKLVMSIDALFGGDLGPGRDGLSLCDVLGGECLCRQVFCVFEVRGFDFEFVGYTLLWERVGGLLCEV